MRFWCPEQNKNELFYIYLCERTISGDSVTPTGRVFKIFALLGHAFASE